MSGLCRDKSHIIAPEHNFGSARHLARCCLDHCRVPGRMEISRMRVGFHGDTIAAFVSIRGCVQGLVNIANQINQERQIAAGAPFVTISLFEAAHVTHRSSP